MELGPRLIFWEITKRCNLRCPYCRREGYSDSGLKFESALYVVDSIAKGYQPLIVFTGGEPLLYAHIFEVACYAHDKGMAVALATNATSIDRNVARDIRSTGFHRVAVSIDGASEETNDAIRGKGTFSKALAGIRYLKDEGLSLQINTTLFKGNLKEIPSIHRLCLELEVNSLHIFAFVPVGCGRDLPKEMRLSSEELERFLNEMAHLVALSRIDIKLTCAPQFHRVLLERLPSYYEQNGLGRGCLAASSVSFISAEGDLYPCGYLPVSAGNVFKEDFKEIWLGSSLFQTLRDTNNLKGRCSRCEYAAACGGCRARAYALTGDYLGEEPDCVYQPFDYAQGRQ